MSLVLVSFDKSTRPPCWYIDDFRFVESRFDSELPICGVQPRGEGRDERETELKPSHKTLIQEGVTTTIH